MTIFTSTKLNNLIKGVIIFLIISSNVFAQREDDPSQDHVPLEYIKYIQSYQSDASDAVITDDQGYDNFNLGTAFAEPHLVQNPTNPLQYFTSFNTNTAYRTDDAFNWLISAPPFGATTYGDPVNAYDSLGNLFYENMSGSGTIQNCRVIRSTNNGTTWGTSVIAVLGNDKNWIAADQTSGPYANYIYTTMTNSGTGSFYRSTDHGATFTSTNSFATQSLPGMMVAVGPDTNGTTDVPGGCVYVVTNSGSSFASTYTFYVSTNGGTTFTLKSAQNFSGYVGTNVGGRNSVQNMRTRPYPFITADNSYGPNRGRLYLVYASNTPAGDGNKPDIYCRYSTNQGATWSSARVINDDPSTTLNNQWHPSIWCDKTSGRLFVKWMDTRDTPTSDSAHIYASYSDDGGVTFAPNQRITTVKMKINCTTCGGGGTPRYQGDYDAITALDNQALMVWTDFRAGTFGSYVGFFPDYAMQVTPAIDSVLNDLDSVFYSINVPSVKLYNNDVIFSAIVSPTPTSGTIDISFPNGNTLSTFPGAIAMKVGTTGNVSVGSYTILVSGKGPNGTPVHKRIVSLVIVPPTAPSAPTNLTTSADTFSVNLDWMDNSDNELGFILERKDGDSTNTNPFIVIDTVTANQTNFTDFGLSMNTTYTYRVFAFNSVYSSNYSNLSQVTTLTILPISFQLTVSLQNGWNIVSIPGFHPIDQNVNTWWSGRDQAAGVFKFLSGYQQVATVEPGTGYWMKHLGANTYSTGDEWPSGGIQIAAHNSIDGVVGWNLIGGYEYNAATSGITTTPLGLQDSPVYAYSGGYYIVNYLVPGYGYWIKLSGSGLINFPNAFAKEISAVTNYVKDDWGKIIITDKSGNSYTLYTVKGDSPNGAAGVNLNDYELPPAPPEGMFDVRFGSGRYAEQLGAALQTIELNSLEYPVSVRVENADIRLQDGTGSGFNERLKSGEEVNISNSTINKLMVSRDVIPEKYALEQNYPNPFNPSTKIEFSIPEDVNDVTLSIYNALGQKVAELVNSKMEAGKYSYVWNAGDVATGLYIYELRTDKFVSVKKMMLLK